MLVDEIIEKRILTKPRFQSAAHGHALVFAAEAAEETPGGLYRARRGRSPWSADVTWQAIRPPGYCAPSKRSRSFSHFRSY
jgi:hypothetical protein